MSAPHGSPARSSWESAPLAALEHGVPFADRHIGPDAAGLARMLETIGVGSLEELADTAMPSSIRTDPADWSDDPTGHAPPPPATEAQVLDELRGMAARNTTLEPMLGLGYHGTLTPPVIRRNVLEDPAWYTAYTPYQPEISQGRLEALLNFQTMVCDLTGLDVAGASMLDESTAAAEAMLLLRRADKTPAHKDRPSRFLVDADTLPQTVAVLETRAEALGIELQTVDVTGDLPNDDFFGLLLAAPGASGALRDHRAVIEAVHDRGAAVIAACDLLAATMVTPPGDLGADVAVGSTQRFGVPLGFGGPHAGFLAVRQGLARQLPGRLVGTSIDADGDPAHRLALQTREQHIRRDKATSNICTAQVLLAVIAAMYAVHHGPTGLRTIARRTHRMAAVLAAGLVKGGVEVVHREFFDTVLVRVPGEAPAAVAACRAEGILVREVDADHVGVSCSERTTREHLRSLWRALGAGDLDVSDLDAATADAVPATLERTSSYLTHPVFHRHRSETALLRYLRELSDKDVALDRSMIPLGSCTMKLNATAEMEPITYPGLRRPAPVRARVRRAGDAPGDHGPRGLAGAPHRLPRGLAAAQRRLAGRARRPAGHPRLPPLAGRRAPRRVPHPVVGARHERRVGDLGGHAGQGREDHRPRRRRLRRPGEGHRGERRHARGDHDHLPVDARGVRAARAQGLRGGARRRRAGLRRRRQPQRPGRARPPRPIRRRRQPPEPAQDLLHPARRRGPRRRPGRRRRAPRAVPAEPPGPAVRRARRPGSARSPARPGARRRSCRSPGPTSGSWASTGCAARR